MSKKNKNQTTIPMSNSEIIREDLINEIFNESTSIGNIIMSSSREDELTNKEFSILLNKQIERITK